MSNFDSLWQSINQSLKILIQVCQSINDWRVWLKLDNQSMTKESNQSLIVNLDCQSWLSKFDCQTLIGKSDRESRSSKLIVKVHQSFTLRGKNKMKKKKWKLTVHNLVDSPRPSSLLFHKGAIRYWSRDALERKKKDDKKFYQPMYRFLLILLPPLPHQRWWSRWMIWHIACNKIR